MTFVCAWVQLAVLLETLPNSLLTLNTVFPHCCVKSSLDRLAVPYPTSVSMEEQYLNCSTSLLGPSLSMPWLFLQNAKKRDFLQIAILFREKILQIVEIFKYCVYIYSIIIWEKTCHVSSHVFCMYFTSQISTNRISEEVICDLFRQVWRNRIMIHLIPVKVNVAVFRETDIT